MRTHLRLLMRFSFSALLLLALYATLSGAQGSPDSPQILLVSSQHLTEMTHRIEAALLTEAPTPPTTTHLTISELENYDLSTQRFKLIVTVGDSALQAVLDKKIEIPTLASIIRKDEFQSILQEHHWLLHANHLNLITALYLDQPLERYLNLVKCLVPNTHQPKSVGIILGSHSSYYQSSLRQAAQKKGMALNLIQINPTDHPMHITQYILEEAKVLLALPDHTVYNSQTARGILLSAFRMRVPIIAYSQAYVNLGALAAVYAPPSQTAIDIADAIIEILQNPQSALFAPRYPANFKVALNAEVQRILSAPSHTESSLQYSLAAMEQNPSLSCKLPKQ